MGWLAELTRAARGNSRRFTMSCIHMRQEAEDFLKEEVQENPNLEILYRQSYTGKFLDGFVVDVTNDVAVAELADNLEGWHPDMGPNKIMLDRVDARRVELGLKPFKSMINVPKLAFKRVKIPDIAEYYPRWLGYQERMRMRNECVDTHSINHFLRHSDEFLKQAVLREEANPELKEKKIEEVAVPAYLKNPVIPSSPPSNFWDNAYAQTATPKDLIWKTADGRRMRVSEMTQEHLENAMNRMQREGNTRTLQILAQEYVRREEIRQKDSGAARIMEARRKEMETEWEARRQMEASYAMVSVSLDTGKEWTEQNKGAYKNKKR
jgi:hypothetical protein